MVTTDKRKKNQNDHFALIYYEKWIEKIKQNHLLCRFYISFIRNYVICLLESHSGISTNIVLITLYICFSN